MSGHPSNLLKSFRSRKAKNQKCLAVLIDPESISPSAIARLVKLSSEAQVDYFFVGGSTAGKEEMDATLDILTQISSIPTIIFPGNTSQLSNKADGLLYLSLISGRNPELLIGKHIESVPFLRQSSLEIIPTGYILIDGGKLTTVAYISNTTPIPSHMIDATVATALAGQYLGMQMIYLEAGSGATTPVATATIEAVNKALEIPLIVGGGIRTAEQAKKSAEAGADIIVIGNILEKDPDLLSDLSIAIHSVGQSHTIR